MGEDLVKIPNTQWLTTYHVCDEESSPLCYKLSSHTELQACLEGWSYCFFAVFFAEQKKNPKSKHLNYIKSLPHNISNYPELFNEEELLWLEGS